MNKTLLENNDLYVKALNEYFDIPIFGVYVLEDEQIEVMLKSKKNKPYIIKKQKHYCLSHDGAGNGIFVFVKKSYLNKFNNIIFKYFSNIKTYPLKINSSTFYENKSYYNLVDSFINSMEFIDISFSNKIMEFKKNIESEFNNQILEENLSIPTLRVLFGEIDKTYKYTYKAQLKDEYWNFSNIKENHFEKVIESTSNFFKSGNFNKTFKKMLGAEMNKLMNNMQMDIDVVINPELKINVTLLRNYKFRLFNKPIINKTIFDVQLCCGFNLKVKDIINL